MEIWIIITGLKFPPSFVGFVSTVWTISSGQLTEEARRGPASSNWAYESVVQQPKGEEAARRDGEYSVLDSCWSAWGETVIHAINSSFIQGHPLQGLSQMGEGWHTKDWSCSYLDTFHNPIQSCKVSIYNLGSLIWTGFISATCSWTKSTAFHAYIWS